MNLKKLLPLLFLLLMWSLKGLTQSSGNVYFFVHPENAIIKVDDAPFTQKKEIITMKPGKYKVKMWAPGRKLTEDTLMVTESGVTFFRRKLEQTNEYKKYRFQKMQYTIGNLSLKLIPLPLTLVLASSQYNSYKDHSKEADRLLDLAKEVQASYPSILTEQELNDARERFETYSEQYDNEVKQANKKLKSSQITFGSGLLVSAACFYFSTKLHKPVYSETPLLSGIGVNIYDRNSFGVSCLINIARK